MHPDRASRCGSGDLEWARPSAWLFAVGIVVSAIVYVVFYVSLERRGPRSV